MKTQNKETKRSEYRGVSWCSRRKAWRARIQVNGCCMVLGHFESSLDAAKKFNEYAEKFGARVRNALPLESVA